MYGEVQRWYRKFQYTLCSASLNVNILHNYDTFVETQKGTLAHYCKLNYRL